MVRAGAYQSPSVISSPAAVNHARSRSPSAPCGRPEKKARRRSTGCARRSASSRLASASSSRAHPSSSSDQSTQPVSLSWQ
ncbi:hypothetical protein BG846_04889 [Streptomyces fradiae ATCC 10745 = DSM 40063]|uniref:Uncharacterized protein n=1 Tax=Streptomyces fradiae ATCC 10745 = DSM 40063 TaxID=1319510 RepID=A0A1Y2NPU7_STRFR|nr:hypothetical protein BG846_04889 [Streptomyces fradiae ATCC 10745 = DSM 40063]